jgi:hypothetical protein
VPPRGLEGAPTNGFRSARVLRRGCTRVRLRALRVAGVQPSPGRLSTVIVRRKWQLDVEGGATERAC